MELTDADKELIEIAWKYWQGPAEDVTPGSWDADTLVDYLMDSLSDHLADHVTLNENEKRFFDWKVKKGSWPGLREYFDKHHDHVREVIMERFKEEVI